MQVLPVHLKLPNDGRSFTSAFRLPAFFLILCLLAFLVGCAAKNDSNNSEAISNKAENRTSPRTENTRAENVSPAVKSAPQNSPRSGAVETEDAAAVIRSYYAAINKRDYRKAYELWSGEGEASKQTFEEFKNGFADTASVEIKIGAAGDVEGAAGSRFITIPVSLEAKNKTGGTEEFSGEYVLRRSVVDGATAEQKAWRIYSADVKKRA